MSVMGWDTNASARKRAAPGSQSLLAVPALSPEDANQQKGKGRDTFLSYRSLEPLNRCEVLLRGVPEGGERRMPSGGCPLVLSWCSGRAVTAGRGKAKPTRLRNRTPSANAWSSSWIRHPGEPPGRRQRHTQRTGGSRLLGSPNARHTCPWRWAGLHLCLSPPPLPFVCAHQAADFTAGTAGAGRESEASLANPLPHQVGPQPAGPGSAARGPAPGGSVPAAEDTLGEGACCASKTHGPANSRSARGSAAGARHAQAPWSQQGMQRREEQERRKLQRE